MKRVFRRRYEFGARESDRFLPGRRGAKRGATSLAAIAVPDPHVAEQEARLKRHWRVRRMPQLQRKELTGYVRDHAIRTGLLPKRMVLAIRSLIATFFVFAMGLASSAAARSAARSAQVTAPKQPTRADAGESPGAARQTSATATGRATATVVDPMRVRFDSERDGLVVETPDEDMHYQTAESDAGEVMVHFE